jgi:hypothetical protein
MHACQRWYSVLIETPEILYTLTEVAIAYVGFAAIFGALSSRAEVWPPEVQLMFRALVEVGLLIMFLCLTPIALELIDVDGADRWQVASLIGITLGAFLTAWRAYLVRSRLLRLPREAPFLFFFTIINFAILATNAIVWRTAGPYVIAIIMSLAAGSSIFLAMIFRMFPISAKSTEDIDS